MGACWICDGTGVLDPVEALRRLVHDLDELIGNSEGVAGLHMNGDVAEWGSLTSGGMFGEWLGSLDVAREAAKGNARDKPCLGYYRVLEGKHCSCIQSVFTPDGAQWCCTDTDGDPDCWEKVDLDSRWNGGSYPPAGMNPE